MPLSVSNTDLIVRVYGNADVATTWTTRDGIEEKMRFRLDAQVWDACVEEDQIRIMIQAYNDLARLPWSGSAGRSSQDYDVEAYNLFGYNDLGPEPPLHSPAFQRRIVEAQVAQIIWLLQGTQIRDLQRDGVRMTRQLQGSELDIAGYRGPVSIEAIELLEPFIDLQPKLSRTFK
jgi:hypothetical protein